MKNALKKISFDLPVMLQSKLLAVKSQKGVTMIEYALLGSLVAVVAMVGLKPLGAAVDTLFDSLTTALTPIKP